MRQKPCQERTKDALKYCIGRQLNRLETSEHKNVKKKKNYKERDRDTQTYHIVQANAPPFKQDLSRETIYKRKPKLREKEVEVC